MTEQHGRERKVRVEGSPTRCPYCKGELDDPSKIVACVGCGARHHAPCHAEHGRCASCGAAEALVPRASLRRHGVEPPRGSKITVERRGDEVVYSWDRSSGLAVAMGIIFVFLVISAPLGIHSLFHYFKRRRGSLRLLPDAIEFSGVADAGFRERAIVARRADVGSVRLDGFRGSYILTIDVGIERFSVGMYAGTGFSVPLLKGPELEWLREEIEAWKAREA